MLVGRSSGFFLNRPSEAKSLECCLPVNGEVGENESRGHDVDHRETGHADQPRTQVETPHAKGGKKDFMRL